MLKLFSVKIMLFQWVIMMPRKLVSVLMCLFYSTQNAGDLALLETSIALLKRFLPNIEITILANFPQEEWFSHQCYEVLPSFFSLVKKHSTSYFSQIMGFILGCFYAILYKLGIKMFVPENWKVLLRAYEKTDLVIAVPGHAFFSTGRFGWPFPVNIASVALALFFEKPFYVLPQSIGPFRRWWEKKLLRLVYSRARLVFVRDEESLSLAEAIGIPRAKLFYAPDPAFTLEPESKKIAINILQSNGWKPIKYSLGVTVISPMGKSLNSRAVYNYYKILSEGLIQFALRYEMQIVLFCQVLGPTSQEDDRISTRIVYDKLISTLKKDDVILIDKVLSPSMLKACYGEMNMFVASRLHSGIFAISMGVPTVFIGYLPKTEGMLNSIGLSEYSIDLEDLTMQNLILRLNDTWERRDVIRKKLKYLEDKLSREAIIPFIKIASDFSKQKQV